MLLGTIAGAPGIMYDALRGGNVFDPAHMQRAYACGQHWGKRQRRRQDELERLGALGARVPGAVAPANYAHLEAQVPDPGVPALDWFLRIDAGAAGHVDLMTLGSYEHHVHDALLDATRLVPRFTARLFCPTPRVIYVHGV